MDELVKHEVAFRLTANQIVNHGGSPKTLRGLKALAAGRNISTGELRLFGAAVMKRVTDILYMGNTAEIPLSPQKKIEEERVNEIAFILLKAELADRKMTLRDLNRDIGNLSAQINIMDGLLREFFVTLFAETVSEIISK